LGVNDRKGRIKEGADADILIMNGTLQLETVIAKGQIMMQNSGVVCKGTYEK